MKKKKRDKEKNCDTEATNQQDQRSKNVVSSTSLIEEINSDHQVEKSQEVQNNLDLIHEIEDEIAGITSLIQNDEKSPEKVCTQPQFKENENNVQATEAVQCKNIKGSYNYLYSLKTVYLKYFLGLAKVEKLQTEQIDFEKLLNKSKDLMKEIQLEELNEVPKTVIKNDTQEVVKMAIKPYTESQLSALYHNGELDTLDAFINQYVEAELKGTNFTALKIFNTYSDKYC